MCSDPDSSPPIEPVRSGSAGARSIDLVAADGNRFAAYQADAKAPMGAGIIVLPDYHGLTGFYEELALRFAEHGVDAIAVDYYGRTADTRARDTAFDHVRHAGLTTWAGLQADVAAAAAHLRTSRGAASLFSIGFCFGGRVSFLLASLPELHMAGVIGFYGWPVGRFLNDTPAPADEAPRLEAPLMAVFGGADDKIPADQVDAEALIGVVRQAQGRSP